jgi:hypothetical protein
MGCTPPEHVRKVSAVNAHPSRVHLKSVTSIEDILNKENQNPQQFDLYALDIKMPSETNSKVSMPNMDF